VTGGSRLPFRIRPGAPTSSIDISASGSVGIGTASPTAGLHVSDSASDGTTPKFKVENTNGTAASRIMAQFVNNGDVNVNYVNNSTGVTWGTNVVGSDFKIQKAGGPANPVFLLTGSGNLTIGGTLTENSDRNMKTNIVDINADEVLAKVAALPISEWTYKTEVSGSRHVGPMAQDFSAAFHLGDDEHKISPRDMAGVSLAAIQALNKQVSEKNSEIVKLQEQNAELAKRLSDLESLVNSLAAQRQ
jgi:hypothetical protein